MILLQRNKIVDSALLDNLFHRVKTNVSKAIKTLKQTETIQNTPNKVNDLK